MNDDRQGAEQEPMLREVTAGHWAACHHVDGHGKAPLTQPMLDHRRNAVAASGDGGIRSERT